MADDADDPRPSGGRDPSHALPSEETSGRPAAVGAGPLDGDGRGDRGTDRAPGDRQRSEPAVDARANVFLRDFLVGCAVVLLLAGLLFAVSGVWPPMVAVESGSMEPNMEVGDLVFVVEQDRFAGEGAMGSTGVVPADRAAETGHTSFGGHGDVIVFVPDSESGTPIIHRAMLWVEDGENWYDRADPDVVDGAGDCDELRNCPAPNAGFITLGDANEIYDQQTPRTAPVRPEQIVGIAKLRIPYLGYVRLALAGQTGAPLEPGVATAADRHPPGPVSSDGSATANPTETGSGIRTDAEAETETGIDAKIDRPTRTASSIEAGARGPAVAT